MLRRCEDVVGRDGHIAQIAHRYDGAKDRTLPPALVSGYRAASLVVCSDEDGLLSKWKDYMT